MKKYIFILLMILLPISLIVSLFNGSWQEHIRTCQFDSDYGEKPHSWLNNTIWDWYDTFWNGN